VGSLVSWRVLKKEIEEALFLVVMVLASAHLERGGEREMVIIMILRSSRCLIVCSNWINLCLTS
jgi:hypothetical protein